MPRPAATARGATFVALAFACVVADLASKQLVRARLDLGTGHVQLLPFLDLRHTRNTGIAFGLFAGAGAWVVLATVVVGLLLFAFLSKIPASDRATTAGVALVAGGAIGNLVERVARGYVTDFLQLPHWPTFNLADTFITVGVAIVVLAQWLHPPDPEAADAPRG